MISAGLALALAAGGIGLGAAGSSPVKPALVIEAFSGHSGKGPVAPSDSAPPGGSYGSCRYFQRLYAFARFSGMSNGRSTSAVWLLNGARIHNESWRWDEGPRGRTYVYVSAQDTLPDGRYEVQLRVGGTLLADATIAYAKRYC